MITQNYCPSRVSQDRYKLKPRNYIQPPNIEIMILLGRCHRNHQVPKQSFLALLTLLNKFMSHMSHINSLDLFPVLSMPMHSANTDSNLFIFPISQKTICSHCI